MTHALLRTTLLVLIAVLVFGPNDSYGRGPGGRGGKGGGGGARAGGGKGGNGAELSNGMRKRSDGPFAGANGGLNLNGAAEKFGGAAQNFSGPGLAEKFQGAPGKLQNAAGGGDKFQAEKFQNTRQQAGQKWRTRNGEHQQNAQNAVSDFQNGPRPFTTDWYADHPAAWQYTHPHTDAWAAATATGVAAWLGWAAYPQTYGTSSTTVYYEQVPAEEADEDGEIVANQSVDAEDAATAQNDTDEWLSLGVYSVLSDSGKPTSRMLQLNVNRAGEVRGVYYDAISNTSQNLSGNIDQATQLAEWSLDSNPQITFRADLDELTEASGTIEVSQPSGQQEWRVARQQNNS